MNAHARTTLALLAVACIAGTTPAYARMLPPAELASLLEKLEGTLGDIRSLRAPFVQEKHLSIFEDVVSTTGTLYFVPPQNVRIQMDEPFESALITNGHAVAQFERIDGEWKRIRSGGEPVILEVTGQIAAWLRGSFGTQTDIYALSAEVDESTRLVLIPTDPDFAERIARIEITVAPDFASVARIEIREPGGDFTALIFENSERDIELPADLFRTDDLQPVPSSRSATEHSGN